jgi:hypothetical protein
MTNQADGKERIAAKSQRWEVFPKIFAVRVKALFGDSFSVRLSPAPEQQAEALEAYRRQLASWKLFHYGTFGARLYFGNPQLDWGAALTKFVRFTLFLQLVQTPGEDLTQPGAFVSGWGWVGDEPLLSNPLDRAGSERLHDALLRTQFLPWHEYINSASLHGLTPAPDGMFSKETGLPTFYGEAYDED